MGTIHFVDTVYDRVRMDDGRVRANLKDSCHFEPAAYELAKLLHLDSVPPAVTRRIGADNGSLQIWARLVLAAPCARSLRDPLRNAG